jgi:hypothetical protein
MTIPMPVREIEDDENKLELGRIVWDEEIGGAVIEWCADEMPMMSSAAIDVAFVMEVLQGIDTDVTMAKALNMALLREGSNGTLH